MLRAAGSDGCWIKMVGRSWAGAMGSCLGEMYWYKLCASLFPGFDPQRVSLALFLVAPHNNTPPTVLPLGNQGIDTFTSPLARVPSVKGEWRP